MTLESIFGLKKKEEEEVKSKKTYNAINKSVS